MRRIRRKKNQRKRTIYLILLIGILLLLLVIAGRFLSPEQYGPDYNEKKLTPSIQHLFGTDYLGRDMFARTIKGLSNSILIGTLAAGFSACVALVLGILSATIGGLVDKIISYLVDLCMGIPHLVLLMLISFMMGRGLRGVIVGIALTHWPNLTRVIRGEVLQIKNMQYVKVAEKLGKSKIQIAFQHILPHVIPQFIIGLILLFPHAILHEAGVTFLGFGLSVDTPAIGIILSEALKHIATGMWWLVFFPGMMLVMVVMMFDQLGEHVRRLLDPSSARE
ncbi:ABC transporter permease [Anaerosporobacter faecicola]|uniref:ABC transporter permease n=1 Tax=Anaerosporobacter faecicola TaxID=2718714 RepID=UPI00143A066F|nr:ABC transporter permease [Anaerosporobacter faecicola]